MKTKIVYVLVSSENDYFYEQTMISVTSLRLHNLGSKVTLVVDDRTDATLVGKRSELLTYIDERIVIPMDDILPNKERSRRLKTSLRELIKGDYLYIDSDTVICDSLEEIDNFEFPIGMVWDGNQPFDKTRSYVVVQRASKFGHDVSEETDYYNGGVMYVKDCPESHSFCRVWHEEYLKSESVGVVYDQPALMATNMIHEHLIHTISGVYNCQLFMGGVAEFAYAKILHVFNAFGYVNCFRFSSTAFMQKVKVLGHVPFEEVKNLRHPKHFMEGDIVLLHDEDVAFYRSALYHVFCQSKTMFKFLECIGKVYLRLS